MDMEIKGSYPSQTTPRQPLVFCCAAVVLGIAIDRFVACTPAIWLAIGGVSLVWAWSCCLSGRMRRATILVLLGVLATGGAWHHARWNMFRLDDLGFRATEEPAPVCVVGIATTAPRLQPAPPPDPLETFARGDRSHLVLRLSQIRDGSEWRPVSGKARLLVEGHLLEVSAGDQLQVFASLIATTSPRNPGEFDYAALERSRGRLCHLHASHPACVTVLHEGRRYSLSSQIDKLRRQGNQLLWRHLRHRNAGLAAAVLLGVREQVGRDRANEFFVTGTVHLLAISGLHVGILAYGFWLLARLWQFPCRRTLFAAVVLVTIYALVTDARPPVLRAAILISVACVARLSGRQLQGFNTLALAALIVLALNPTHLFQAGTQLSFLAVATLACTSRLWLFPADPTNPLDRLIAQARPWPWRMARRVMIAICQIWLASAAIWIVALPLVMYHFQLITPIALVLNPIVWLPMALALFSGFGVLVFGWLAPPIASICGWFCDANLTLIQWCIDLASLVPGNHMWVRTPPLWWVLAFYGTLAMGLVMPRWRPRGRWILASIIAWIALGLTLTATRAGRTVEADKAELVCTFVAVGHGTSVLLELPDGQNLLYDAGCLGTPTRASQPIATTLRERGIRRLDTIIISHADADHYNAIPRLLDQFRVGSVVVSPMMFDQTSEALATLRAAIDRASVPVHEISEGNGIEAAGDTEVEILHPPPHGVGGSDNANSIVLRVTFAGRSILLPGDLESPGLERLLGTPPGSYDVVMAPHHGSPRSRPRVFAQWSRPLWVVISGGHSSESENVRCEFEAGGARVLHTDQDGAVRVRIAADRFSVEKWRRHVRPFAVR
ncbi:MAG TPA: ComEC/Rec2 family competence protein [Pirellulaceae bacterium]|nr:ComEC/Rec2 family competence protein [Pirellulaceae bacterium]